MLTLLPTGYIQNLYVPSTSVVGDKTSMPTWITEQSTFCVTWGGGGGGGGCGFICHWFDSNYRISAET